jgi:hypothetical protein
MRNRSGTIEQDDEVAKLTLAELNAEIERSLDRYSRAPNPYQRKAFFRRVAWLEELREQYHSVPAPKRTLRARQV